MRVILDPGFLSAKSPSPAMRYILDIIVTMASMFPKDEFVFFSVKKDHPLEGFPANTRIAYISPRLSALPGKNWWRRRLLTTAIKKWQPAVFVSVDNRYVDTKNTAFVLFIVNTNGLPDSGAIKARKGFLRKFMPTLKSTATIIGFSNYSLGMIREKSAGSISNFHLLHPAPVKTMESMPWTEKESTKVQYAVGCEYFVYADALGRSAEMILLLKAFSQFKKRQQSNMQLLLVGNRADIKTEFREKLETFKYRDEVRIISNPSAEGLQSIIGSAYAFVDLDKDDYLPVNMLTALNMSVPIIACSSPVIREMLGNAAIYIDGVDDTGLAKSLQDIYKDENLRTRLIDQGRKQLQAAGKRDIVSECRNIFQAAFTSKS